MSGRSVEDTIQAEMVRVARELGLFVFHPANGGNRSAREGMAFKRIGVMAGIPDLVFVTPRGMIFMEVKTIKGRLSEVQKKVHAELKSMGYKVLVAQGCIHGVALIEAIAEENI